MWRMLFAPSEHMTVEMPTDFVDVYPVLAKQVVESIENANFPKEASEYVKKMLDYTVPGGKMNRGLSVPHTLQVLVPDASEEMIFKANVLGWCVEWLQAFFLVADDIMDHSKTRRGQPCWYLNVCSASKGNIAINDSFILESNIYSFLKKYFRSDKCYVDLLELFHEVTYQTEMGQLIDLLTAPEDCVDLNRFSLDRYLKIVEYKTAYYSFYLPVALALLLSGVTHKSAFKVANDILIPLGVFFQIQDDYLDCFGDPETIGKIGTDIQDNKCSWLVVQALERVTPEQRQLLEQNYGQKDMDKVNTVKQLYRDLNLEQVYRNYEEASYKDMETKINKIDEQVLNKEIFHRFAKKIYKRNK